MTTPPKHGDTYTSDGAIFRRVDCGHYHPYRTCPKCGQAHGWKLVMPTPAPSSSASLGGLSASAVQSPSPHPTT